MKALVGARYDNAAVALPQGLRMESESAIGSSHVGVVSATRGSSLVLLLSRDVGGVSPSYTVMDALELTTPCSGLVLEAQMCDFNGKPDASVIAFMDEVYQCGGHGESSPVRAWRVKGNRFVDVDPARVTCGSLSCEVDRS